MASLMGLPPELGVYTSIFTAPVIALLGRNPVLIGGTASATVPFIAAAVRSQGVGGAAKVSLVAAIIMVGFCVMRLGRHITRVPHAVVTGFSCGIGGMMLISQMDIMLGVASPLTRASSTAVGQLAAVISNLGTPDYLARGGAFRSRHKRMEVSDADAELGAYGIANVCGGMFGAPHSEGIPARSLAVVCCGGSTRLANLLHAVILFGIMRLGGGLMTAWMGLCLLDWSTWRRLPRMSRVDAVAFLCTAVSVMAVNAVLAVAIGCSVYAFHYAYVRWIRPEPGVPGPDLQRAA